MGQTINHRLILLIIILVIVGSIVRFYAETVPIDKNQRIEQALLDIKGWQRVDSGQLEKAIIEALKLDDYVMATYRRGQHPVALYIGYYNTPKKIGAAHDPLVCFPGQGWSVKILNDNMLSIDIQDSQANISYSRMMVSKTNNKMLVVYWFQVDNKTSSNTFDQKVNLLSTKIKKQPGENAFVRVSSEIGSRSIEDVQKDINAFVRSFYPVFLKYVNNEI